MLPTERIQSFDDTLRTSPGRAKRARPEDIDTITASAKTFSIGFNAKIAHSPAGREEEIASEMQKTVTAPQPSKVKASNSKSKPKAKATSQPTRRSKRNVKPEIKPTHELGDKVDPKFAIKSDPAVSLNSDHSQATQPIPPAKRDSVDLDLLCAAIDVASPLRARANRPVVLRIPRISLAAHPQDSALHNLAHGPWPPQTPLRPAHLAYGNAFDQEMWPTNGESYSPTEPATPKEYTLLPPTPGVPPTYKAAFPRYWDRPAPLKHKAKKARLDCAVFPQRGQVLGFGDEREVTALASPVRLSEAEETQRAVEAWRHASLFAAEEYRQAALAIEERRIHEHIDVQFPLPPSLVGQARTLENLAAYVCEMERVVRDRLDVEIPTFHGAWLVERRAERIWWFRCRDEIEAFAGGDR